MVRIPLSTSQPCVGYLRLTLGGHPGHQGLCLVLRQPVVGSNVVAPMVNTCRTLSDDDVGYKITMVTMQTGFAIEICCRCVPSDSPGFARSRASGLRALSGARSGTKVDCATMLAINDAYCWKARDAVLAEWIGRLQSEHHPRAITARNEPLRMNVPRVERIKLWFEFLHAASGFWQVACKLRLLVHTEFSWSSMRRFGSFRAYERLLSSLSSQPAQLLRQSGWILELAS